jgi:hypothetical protein
VGLQGIEENGKEKRRGREGGKIVSEGWHVPLN